MKLGEGIKGKMRRLVDYLRVISPETVKRMVGTAGFEPATPTTPK